MKKGISLFLSVLMVLSLFSCLGVTTFAFDDEVQLDSVSFEPVEAYEFYEYTGGYWDYYYDDEIEDVVCWYDYDEDIPLWLDGNVITLNYSDGTSVEYVCEDGWYYNEYGEILDEDPLYFYSEDEWDKGTNYITMEYEGVCCDIPVEIIESPVESAQFITEEPVTLIKGVDGDMYWPADGPYAGEMVFCYDCDTIFTEGTKFVVSFKDGTEKVYEYAEEYDEEGDYYFSDFFDENGECIDWDYFDVLDFQEYYPWTESGDYSFNLYYMGCPFELNVTLVESDIANVSYTPATDFSLIAGFDGEYSYCFCDECVENDEEFFLYDVWSSGFPCEGDVVTVTYNDGESVDYAYSAEYDWFYDEDGNELLYDAGIYDEQIKEHWDIGYNQMYFWYAGHSAAIPVEVIDNPLVGFEVSLGKSSIYEETDGYYDVDYNDEEFFFYECPVFADGTELIFSFADGSEKVYYYDIYEEWFVSEDGSYLQAVIETDEDNQYDEPWGVGAHDVVVAALGYEYTVTVNVIANPIESIEFTPAEVLTFQAFEDGWWDWYYDENGDIVEFFYYDIYNYSPYTEGNKLVVNYTRGTSDTFIYDEEIGNFVNSRGQQLTKAYDVIYWDVQDYEPWSEESPYNYIIVEFMGRNTYVWVNIENGLPGTPQITGVYNDVGRIYVEWDYLPGAAEYRVYRRGAGQTYWTYLGTTDDNYFYDESSAIKADAYYRYTVRSVNSHGFGSFDTNGAVIRYIAPVTGVKATNAVDGIHITWDSYPNANCMVLRLAAGASEWEYVANAKGSGYYVADAGVANGKYYRYAVVAYKGAYYSGIDQTALIKCVATPKLTGISNATNGIYIKWNAISGATGYRVYRRGAGQSTWTYLGTTKNLYFTDTAVKNASGNYYRYTVRAVSYNTFSGFDANGLYIKRLASPVITSTKSSSSGITVKWLGVSGAQGYYVYRKTGSSSWTYLGYVTGTSYLDKSASKGVTYTYTVKARSGNTTSSYIAGTPCKDVY
ncbi:MAG: hypothetical protein J6D06_07675 [Clostridia bacterium]|nr:hypothetical protein [Clostridia bacterium]